MKTDWTMVAICAFGTVLLCTVLYMATAESIAKAGKCGNPFHIEGCAK